MVDVAPNLSPSPVSNTNSNISNNSTDATEYGLFRVKHSDGSETTTLIAPFVLSTGLSALLQGMGLLMYVDTLQPDLVAQFVNAPVNIGDFLSIVKDVAGMVTVSALLTAGVAAINHALCVYVRPYRRLNATLTLASEHAPLTVTTCTAATAVVAGVVIVSQRPPTQSFSLMSSIFWMQIAPGYVGLAALSGRFLGQTVSASWYGVDARRTKSSGGTQQ
jgi:hypothetical protein